VAAPHSQGPQWIGDGRPQGYKFTVGDLDRECTADVVSFVRGRSAKQPRDNVQEEVQGKANTRRRSRRRSK